MKNLNQSLIEVLSPAGNPECFYAAINNGADAVYLGLSSFNARMRAENFNTSNIRDFIKHAHTFGVKVYITINTLLKDDDFDELVKMVKVLIDAKADAFIVQDYGVAHVLKTCFDGIVLHASTQMGIHNLNGALFAEKLGFSRIVLSRETKLEDIKLIKQHTNLEIEYFVQGALCVAFSGNCYLSSLEKNLSGNEGKCLQLCRLPFTNNQTGETKYYLSARDLSLLENLQTLIDAGVTSLKIEGRMRHSGYVATATSIYKNATLNFSQKTDEKYLKNATKILKNTFSRGDYNAFAYLNSGVTDNVIYPDYQNHIGTKIGTVLNITPFKNDLFKVKIKSSHPLSSGDGLKIINSKTHEQVCSLGVGNVESLNNDEYVIYTKNKFSAGLDVHLTQDANHEKSLLSKVQKLGINVFISAFSNKPLKITLQNKFAKSSIESDFVLEPAKKLPLTKDDFVVQFEKLSNTPFTLDDLTLETDGIFVPKGVLNELRRNAILALLDATITENEKHLNVSFNQGRFDTLKSQHTNCPGKNLTMVDDTNFEPDKNTIFVYSPADYSNCDALGVLQKVKPENFALSLPTILNYADKIVLDKLLNTLPKNIWLFANNIYALYYASLGYNVIASPMLNIKNKFAINCLNSNNIHLICSSIEIDLDFANKHNLIWFKNGRFPLMTFAHCPYKTIYSTTCKDCKYNAKLELKANYGEIYQISRTKVSNCYFKLEKDLSRETANFNLTNFTHQS